MMVTLCRFHCFYPRCSDPYALPNRHECELGTGLKPSRLPLDVAPARSLRRRARLLIDSFPGGQRFRPGPQDHYGHNSVVSAPSVILYLRHILLDKPI